MHRHRMIVQASASLLWCTILLKIATAAQVEISDDRLVSSLASHRGRDPHAMFDDDHPYYDYYVESNNVPRNDVQSKCNCNTNERDKIRVNYGHYRSMLKKVISTILSSSSDSSSDVSTVYLKVRISRDDYHKLQKFVYFDGNGFSDLLTIVPTLNKIVFETYAVKELSYFETIQKYINLVSVNREIALVILAALGFYVLYWWWFIQSRSYAAVTIKFFLIMFLLSSCWKWVHMYKKELARNLATRAKYTSENGIPIECRPNELSYFQTFVAWWSSKLTFSKEACEEYFESVVIEPHWSVSPLDAISDTLWTFLFYPARVLGTTLAHFFTNFLGQLPITVWMPAVSIVVLLIIFTMILHYGYHVRFPIFLMEIKPGGQQQVSYTDRPRIQTFPQEQICVKCKEIVSTAEIESGVDLCKTSGNAEKLIAGPGGDCKVEDVACKNVNVTRKETSTNTAEHF